MKRSINTFSARLLITAVGLAVAFLTPQLALAQVPTVTSISPPYGPARGGGTVTIIGTNFVVGATSVTIGGTPATNVNVVGSLLLQATVPAGSSHFASVEVTTVAGTSSPNTLYGYVLPLQLLDTTTSVGPVVATYTSP